jgi:hypothetical protein
VVVVVAAQGGLERRRRRTTTTTRTLMRRRTTRGRLTMAMAMTVRVIAAAVTKLGPAAVPRKTAVVWGSGSARTGR